MDAYKTRLQSVSNELLTVSKR